MHTGRFLTSTTRCAHTHPSPLQAASKGAESGDGNKPKAAESRPAAKATAKPAAAAPAPAAAAHPAINASEADRREAVAALFRGAHIGDEALVQKFTDKLMARDRKEVNSFLANPQKLLMYFTKIMEGAPGDTATAKAAPAPAPAVSRAVSASNLPRPGSNERAARRPHTAASRSTVDERDIVDRKDDRRAPMVRCGCSLTFAAFRSLCAADRLTRCMPRVVVSISSHRRLTLPAMRILMRTTPPLATMAGRSGTSRRASPPPTRTRSWGWSRSAAWSACSLREWAAAASRPAARLRVPVAARTTRMGQRSRAWRLTCGAAGGGSGGGWLGVLAHRAACSVCVRKRPLAKREKARKEIDVLKPVSRQTILVYEPKYALPAAACAAGAAATCW